MVRATRRAVEVGIADLDRHRTLAPTRKRAASEPDATVPGPEGSGPGTVVTMPGSSGDQPSLTVQSHTFHQTPDWLGL
ncbi:hypothetical protein CCO02nite_15420 [Cellulomonas composti]|uniref:Uncharacterized protein n=1 Tax=Cellulomonas composti TaxID=266130 RepID=A0A511JA82_9CELL|nr:hypothetical protein CCO02nite_15420 [Cellulomonas composti]